MISTLDYILPRRVLCVSLTVKLDYNTARVLSSELLSCQQKLWGTEDMLALTGFDLDSLRGAPFSHSSCGAAGYLPHRLTGPLAIDCGGGEKKK